MAEKQPFGSLINAARGFSQLPLIRQLILLLGLSASIALGFGAVMWSQEPNYRPLYTHLNTAQTTSVVDALQNSGIKYKLDQKDGTVLVASNDVYKTRLKLAGDGLPETGGSSFESLLKDQGIGTSRFMENARYIYALEGELNRTISNLSSVKLARVHLAIPKQSSFIGDNKKPTASVLVDLNGGHQLSSNQVQAIVHLVASSVPDLNADNVTVVDEMGRLLTANHDDNLSQSKEEFDYTRNLEKAYEKRIISILTPLVGDGNVRAKVSALVDFTKVEQTREQYIPDKTAVRSEQVVEQSNGQKDENAKGVPGALSNQPPQSQKKAANGAGSKAGGPFRKQSTRNYELGKTISHSMTPVGKLQKISAAVVVNDKRNVDPKTGKVSETALTQQEIDKIITLVRNTIGYEQQRGDQVSVVNIPFVKAGKLEAQPEPPLWEKTWFWDTIKMSLSGLLIMLLIFLVLRPVLKSLAAKGVDAPPLSQGLPTMGAAVSPQAGQMMAPPPGQVPMQQNVAAMQGQMPSAQGWGSLQQLADDDPKKVAQVMKSWVGNE